MKNDPKIEELNQSVGIECWSAEQIQQAQITAAKEAGFEEITFRDKLDTPEMVVLPAGSYGMGEAFEKHKVTFARPFAVGKYPVTVEEWKRFVDRLRPEDELLPGIGAGYLAGTGTIRGHNKTLLKTPTKATELHHEVLSYVKETNSDLPVTNVNWFDAQDYVRWLSAQTGHTYRLLTEAEWEYACRAGTVTEYYWGDEIGHNNCNCQDSESEWSCRSASPVGSFKPNAFGLYDMLGNAWEWVEDPWHENYEGAPDDGTAWMSDGNRQWRVLRGGCWDSDPRDARAPLRLWIEPSIRNYGIGFRIARAL